MTALGGGAEFGPCPVTSTQSGAVKLATGELSGEVLAGLARGIK